MADFQGGNRMTTSTDHVHTWTKYSEDVYLSPGLGWEADRGWYCSGCEAYRREQVTDRAEVYRLVDAQSDVMFGQG